MQSQFNFDYSKSAIIRPPTESPTDRTPPKTTKVVIDSRDRNTSLYPEPNHYVIQLVDDIDEVVSAELTMTDVPLSSYLINKHNNNISISKGTPDASASASAVLAHMQLPIGDYTKQALAEQLKTTLGIADVTYDPRLDKFTFHGDSDFALEFGEKQDCIARMLGFAPKRTCSSVSGLLHAPYRCNFNVSKYLILTVEGINIINSSNPVLHQSTVLLSHGGMDMIGIRKIIKFKNPCIPRLNRIEFTFTDYEGNLYDFQNQDHRIDLVFESKKHLSKYLV
jgi:hypothetical protein